MSVYSNFFGKDEETINETLWDWKNFKSTKGFPVSENLMDWIIGQEKAMEECKLCMDEWINKLKYLKKREWWKAWSDPSTEKPEAKEWLPAGPFLLLLGTQGTGKSLLGRALATHLTELYKAHEISLYDVICWRNDIVPSEPKISIKPSPKGRKIVRTLKRKEARKGRLKSLLTKGGSILLAGIGAFMLFIAFYSVLMPWFANNLIVIDWTTLIPIQEYYNGNFFLYLIDAMKGNFILFMVGGNLIMVSFMISFFGRFMRGNLTGKGGIGGAEKTKAPKLIVDNAVGIAKFVDATGHGSSQLFGSIAWDPYQTGGLGTPEHQRASAGDVHRAFMGILYIDEIKNLKPVEAVTLLTVLEDGQLPIALRDTTGLRGGGTSAMAVSTEPVPCMTFLVAAGNMDSVPQIHPALMDRIYGYGKVVYMNDDMPNTVKNRRKYVQFIAQEIKRFNLLPLSREACIEIIEESRRKSGRNTRLSCLFRPMISIIKTSSILALNEGLDIVEKKHVIEAVNEHCKTIEMQVLERVVKDAEDFRIINSKADPLVGQIYGMAVSQAPTSSAKMGSIIPLRTSILELVNKKSSGSFIVTGISEKEGSWVQNSIQKVAHVISQLYTFKNPLRIHIDFAQQIGVDGPSAGVAMTLGLISVIEKKKVRQDIAVTGEINLAVPLKTKRGRWKPADVIVTPVGGLHEKIIAAQRMGFKKVLIPKLNAEKNIRESDYTIEIIGCETLADYVREIFAN